MYRYAYWLSGDKATAEVLVQETFLRVGRFLDSLKDKHSAKSWLTTILRRENARRFERKQLDYSDLEMDTIASERQDFDTRPEVLALRSAMHKLPVKYRETLVLQVLEGTTLKKLRRFLSYPETPLPPDYTELARNSESFWRVMRSSYASMNCLEFRRLALADPYDPALNAQAESCAKCAKFRNELIEKDSSIEKALNVEVPDDLAAGILLNQALKESNDIRTWVRYSMAASFAAALVLSGYLLNSSQTETPLDTAIAAVEP